MFRFSSAQRDRPSGNGYLRQLQQGIKNKVRGPVRTDNHERSSPSSWKILERTLRALQTPAQHIPPLKSAIDGLVSVLNVYEDAIKSRRDQEILASSLVASIDILKQQLESSKSTRINDRILEIASHIEQEVRLIRHQQDRSRPGRIVAQLENEDAIESYQRIERLFHRIQLEVGMSAWRTAHEHLENERLENINPAKLANYNSMLSTEINRRGCTENTRRMILSSICQWSDDPLSSRINWMSGMAGTGKTTIAYTLSTVLDTHEQLAASFFCTKASPECRDAGRIIPTLAYQLARKSIAFQSALCKTLEQDPDIASRDIPTQFRSLFQEPLQKIEREIPNNLIIVIDALDECEDAEAVGQLLSALFKHATTLPVKFFLTSRPELELANRIQKGLRTNEICSTSHLHEIERSTVQSDIESYLEDELAFMSPSPNDIQRLAKASGQLFIYAVTAVRYIRPGRIGVDHDERLATMLAVHSTSQKRFAHIDALYSTVLSAALDNADLEVDERDRILQVLWTVVCLREPVHVEALKEFTGLRNIKQTLIALLPLRSILYVSEKSSYVSVLHQSFPDYLLDPKRSGKFSCDPRKLNHFLAHRCFKLMKLELKFNICGLESSFFADRDIVDIKERIDNNISDSLAYACRYWGDHISLADATDELLVDVQDFLRQRLLFWMEVMNLNRHMGIGVGALLRLHAWLTVSRVPAPSYSLPSVVQLRGLANDASMFVASFAGQPVSLSTPHIYVSALLLVPSSSHIAKLYRKGMREIRKQPTTLPDREDGWTRSEVPHPPQLTDPGLHILPTSEYGRPAQSAKAGQLEGNDHHVSIVLPAYSVGPPQLPYGHSNIVPSNTILSNGNSKPTMPIPGVLQASNTAAPPARVMHPHTPGNAGIFSAPYRSAPLSAPTAPVHVLPSASESNSTPLVGTRVLYATPQAIPCASGPLAPPLFRPKGYAYRRVQETTLSKGSSNEVPFRIDEESSEVEPVAPRNPLPIAKPGHAPYAQPMSDSASRPRGPRMLEHPSLGVQIPSINYPWKIRSDGWILNRNAGLLLFIPPNRNDPFGAFKSLNSSWQNILPGIDWGKLYVGDRWTKYNDI